MVPAITVSGTGDRVRPHCRGNRRRPEARALQWVSTGTAKNVAEGVESETKDVAGNSVNNEKLADESHDEHVEADARQEKKKEAHETQHSDRTWRFAAAA